jgi:hypothetical protein
VPEFAGNGFQVVQKESAPIPAAWSGRAPTMAEQQEAVAKEAAIPTWMSPADRHMLNFEGITPFPWEQSMEVARLGYDKVFGILEQRRVEECAVPPSPDNDVIIGVALVVWCAHHVSVLKMFGQQDYPIAVTARALKVATGCIQQGSTTKIIPETHEVYEVMRMSNDILAHGWDSNMYCTVPERVEFIRSIEHRGKAVEVHGIDEEHCEFTRLRSQGRSEAQEAMELAVSVREGGYQGSQREAAPTKKRIKEKTGSQRKR